MPNLSLSLSLSVLLCVRLCGEKSIVSITTLLYGVMKLVI
jgi:hypothetical protein